MTSKSRGTLFAAVKLPKCLEGPHNTYDRSTNNIKCNKEAEATAGMDTAARMTLLNSAKKVTKLYVSRFDLQLRQDHCGRYDPFYPITAHHFYAFLM